MSNIEMSDDLTDLPITLPSGPFATPYDGALAMVIAGQYVFPVNGKTPLIKQWREMASNEIGQVDEWAEQFKNCNWGWVYDRSGLGMVDTDVEKDDPEHLGEKIGERSWRDLEAVNGETPPTYTIETPSGGLHRVFIGSLPQTAGKLGTKIDTRGGYGLVPGSLIDGKPYEVVSGFPPADLPSWIIPALQEANAKATVTSTWDGDEDLPINIDQARSYLKLRRPAVEGEHGDEVSMGTAADLRKFGLSRETILGLMQDWNQTCSPPWTEDGLEAKVDAGIAHCANANQVGLNAITEAPDAFLQDIDTSSFPGVEWTQKLEPPCTSGGSPPTQGNADDIAEELPGLEQPDAKTNDAGLRRLFPNLRPLHRKEFKNRPKLRWLYKDLLYLDTNAMLVAQPSVGKTTIALELAGSACTGLPAFGTELPSKTGAVFYLCGEGEGGLMSTRTEAWEKFHHVDLSDYPFFVLPAMPQVQTEAEFPAVAAWIDHLAAGQEVALIVLDTLSTAIGGMKGNDDEAMNRVIEAAKGLQRRFQCTVLTLHHPVKSASDDNLLPRGSGALWGGYDTILTAASKVSLFADLGVLKQRDGRQDFIHSHLAMKVVDVGGPDDDAFTMTTALIPVRQSDAEAAKAADDLQTLRGKVEHVLKRLGLDSEVGAIGSHQLAIAIYGATEHPPALGSDWTMPAGSDHAKRVDDLQKQIVEGVRARRDRRPPILVGLGFQDSRRRWRFRMPKEGQR